MMRLVPKILPLACAAALLVGCGDDDTTGTSSSDTSAASSDTTEASPDTTEASSDDEPSTDEQQQVVEASLLTLDDLPPGWTEEPNDDTTTDEEDEAQKRAIAECIGADYDRLYAENVNADSPTFVSPDDAEVSSSAGLEESEEDAQYAMDALTTDEALQCTTEALQEFIEGEAAATMGDAEIGAVSIERMSFPDFGDQTTAIRIALPITAQGQSVDIYLDMVIVRIGRGGVEVQTMSLFTPFDTAQLEELVGTTVDRFERNMADAGV